MEDRKALRKALGLFYLKEKMIYAKINLDDKLDLGKGGCVYEVPVLQ